MRFVAGDVTDPRSIDAAVEAFAPDAAIGLAAWGEGGGGLMAAARGRPGAGGGGQRRRPAAPPRGVPAARRAAGRVGEHRRGLRQPGPLSARRPPGGGCARPARDRLRRYQAPRRGASRGSSAAASRPRRRRPQAAARVRTGAVVPRRGGADSRPVFACGGAGRPGGARHAGGADRPRLRQGRGARVRVSRFRPAAALDAMYNLHAFAPTAAGAGATSCGLSRRGSTSR